MHAMLWLLVLSLPALQGASPVDVEGQDWWVAYGSCALEADGCISSTNYPHIYPKGDACKIELAPDNRRAIVVTHFSAGRDGLHVNGERYTGAHGPDGVVPRMPILWSSDDSENGKGWKICLGDVSAATRTLQAQPWLVESGSCTAEGFCISSSNFPSDYPDFDACSILVAEGNVWAINVVAFSTESFYDELIVNGIAYSGADGPQAIVPEGTIQWSSDRSVNQAGWQICLQVLLTYDEAVSCGFELNACNWHSSSEAWRRNSFPGALEGGSHMRLSLEAGNASGEALGLESGYFQAGDERQLSFFYRYDVHAPTVLVLLVESWNGTSWTSLWSANGTDTNEWQLAAIVLPREAQAVRFLGYGGLGGGNVDVDAIRGGPAVWDADLLSCDFVDHTCAWMAGSSWQRNATDEGWNLQAISPSNGVAMLRSFKFVATAVETNLVLSFWIGGSGARLEVQHKTVASNWTSLAMLVESSSQLWRRVVVEVPLGTEALRLLAAVPTPQDLVQVDSLAVFAVAASLENVSCSFETDFCLWSTKSPSLWSRHDGSTSSGTGPDNAFRGDWFAQVADGNQSNKDFLLTSPWFDVSSSPRQIHFAYHIDGDTGSEGTLSLQAWDLQAGWTTLWSGLPGLSLSWRQAAVSLPQQAQALRFHTTGQAGAVAVDGIGHAAVQIEALSCEFQLETCLWAINDFSWQYGNITTTSDSHFLQAVATSDTSNTSILESFKFVATAVETNLVLSFWIGGSGARLEVQHKTVASNWTSLAMLVESSSQLWRRVVVEVPLGTEALRLLAAVPTPQDLVQVDSLAVFAVAASLENVSCSFETDFCLWSTKSPSLWSRHDASTSSGAGPDNAFRGDWFAQVADGSQSNKDFLLTSPWFDVSSSPRQIHFAYHIDGDTGSEGTLSLQAWDLQAGWLQIWQRSGHGALQWRFGMAIVPENAAALRIVASPASSSGGISLDAISTSVISPSYDILTCSFEADTCGWTASDAQAWKLRSGFELLNQHSGPSGPWKGTGYMLFSSTDEHQGGEFALESPSFSLGDEDEVQMNFAFHMFGSDVESLELQYADNTSWKALWHRSGNQGQDWRRASVRLPQHAEAVRFVGTMGAHDFAGDMALDEFSVGPAESEALSCDFELDACSWEIGSWQRVSGRDAAGQSLANDGDWHLEAGGTSQPGIFVLESPVILTSNNTVAFTLAYRIIGSEGAKLELQHKLENSTWTRLFVQAGHQGHRWQHAAIDIPQGSTALRITATTAMAEDSVFVDSLYALDMVPEMENISCRFTGADLCGWTTGTWRRDSNDYVFYLHHEDVGQAKLTSRPFLVQGPSYVEFWYGTSGHPGTLTLEFLMRGRWWRLWSRTGPQGDQWNEAKLSIPEQARQFRFRTSEWPTSTASASAFYLASIMLSKAPASRSYLTLAVGGNHNCAVLSSTGQLKCWGLSSYLGLGLSTSDGVGDDPDEMGVNLPIVDLGQRVEQVTCDNFDCCAVLADGALKCWGSQSAWPSLVDLGTGVKVSQVSNGYQHKCALLQNGDVKCWGWNDNGQLGLGDSQTRGRGGDSDMGDNLPAIDLGANFTVIQLTGGIFHTCALSSDGEVKCWGGNEYGQLGGSAGNIGDQPGTMGTSLAPVELGSKATYIAAAGGHTCAVLEGGAAVCWGANWNGQLGLGSTQAFGQNSSEMGANMPHVPLGTGMFAERVSVSFDHSCAILQDASLKCWGSGAYGTLGQGSTDSVGDEPNEMGDNLRPINIGSLRVLQVGAGAWHTCALFDDDSTRCWGRSAPRGALGTGSGDNVGDGANEMGSNLVAADLFRPTLREQVDAFRLMGGDERQGWLELSQNGTWGLICDDAWLQSKAAAEAACRDLGMAGGTPLAFDAGSAPILADGMKCSDGEVTLRDCTFRGWSIHDCTSREAAGVRCELDAWSSFTAPGPSGRQDHTTAWDSESQSALLLGGHASSQFLHFSDLWEYRWPLRRWTQLHPQGPVPSTRSGHSAVFDAHSKSMLMFAGGHLGNFYNELWQFLISSTSWRQLSSVLLPAPRAKHSAVWDAKRQGMVVFGGHNSLPLGDLSHYDMRRNTWSSLAAGPLARSGHAAVWEPVTASLLVCGGWTGTEYLQDLQLYNWWSNTWKELEPVRSPWPRAGHAAVWDEASMSMLVFGGVEDSNGTLSYDPVLHFYNFLANTWTEANRSGPSGRRDPSVVWDSSTHALLAFGGFNSSYLDDLWRYVTSPVELPLLLVNCRIGEACQTNASSGSGMETATLTIRSSCSVPGSALASFRETSDGQVFIQQDNQSSMWLEAGSYQICLCRLDQSQSGGACSTSSDFDFAVGSLIVEGPYPDQHAECPLGGRCQIPSWRGVGLSANDSLHPLRRCGSTDLTSLGERSIALLPEGSGFTVDVGDVEMTGLPELVLLCWCPSDCREARDFRVPALQLHLVCPQGFHKSEDVCMQCPQDHFCPGDQQSYRCPFASTAAPGSSDILQCECVRGYYRNSDSCLACPYGSTSQAGATSLASCTCLPNFVNTQPDNPAICQCGPGFGFNGDLAVCEPCPKGSYKAVAGDTLCSSCSADKTTLTEASISALDCLCRSGLAANGTGCTECPPGFFCDAGEVTACQSGSNSTPGTRSPDGCICKEGYYRKDFACELCQPGRYKPTEGNQALCPGQCPTSGESARGSRSLSDCSCLSGFYAELDSAGFLARCASCAAFTALQCPGGFRDQTSSHQLPVAIPGYFQTSRTSVVKCTVVLDGGISVCLGSDRCQQSGEDGNCIGKYGNACAEGSTGNLCGECPTGWSRPSFRAPCRLCKEAVLQLVASILADVGSKIIINFVVASMAATAAARASSKLHTIMIRIVVQFVSACSVIATFELDQIQVMFPWQQGTDSQAMEEPARFGWPPEVTAAMRDLFALSTLTPAVVSVDLAAQCIAQDLSDHPAAPRIALGLYNMCLPLLVMVAGLGTCSLAVYVLVPVAARWGLSFNEAGRRRRKRAKLLQTLREAVEVALHKNGLSLSWADLEQCGTLDVRLAVLQRAVEEPDAFLRKAVVRSRDLLIRACAERAQVVNRCATDEVAFSQVDLSHYMREDFAYEATDLSDMLDQILAALEQQEMDSSSQPGLARDDLSAEARVHVQPKPGSLQLQPPSSEFDEDPEVDEAMDSLDFGLFTQRPSFPQLVYQSVPVFWIALVSLWPGLLSNFLAMLWCVPIVEDERVVSRLLPNPDVECWTDAHFPSAALAVAGLVLWCVGIPLVLAAVLFRMKDRQAADNCRRFGYFIQGLEPQYWWWDILVKRIDVGLMMLVTYTSAVQDPATKLLLFPVLSGFQAVVAAWVKPYSNDQAEVLDFVEVTLAFIRFLLFSSVAALMLLNPTNEITTRCAYLMLFTLILTWAFFCAHVLSQLLRSVSVQSTDDNKMGPMKLVGDVKNATLRVLLPLFQEEETEKLRLTWSFTEQEITVAAPRLNRASFAVATRKLSSKVRVALQRARGKVLRMGPSFQHAVLVKANEEFMTFWLQQLGRSDFPREGGVLMCILATAHKALPGLLARSRIGPLWTAQVDLLTASTGPFTCGPEDLSRSVWRLGQMPADDAAELVQHVVSLCSHDRRPESESEYLEM